ncbi:hypothetical protein CMUS01_00251 [Colletotrichum musicola]|uniref:Uncharacterized protein n=1 Tax=Colletotrichum musicola TaxID=2175873 RepID=A0A8H6U9S0_9PEZI|nr:hypothetical protein CMUS01_00251 [Colletotrichum musicola]
MSENPEVEVAEIQTPPRCQTPPAAAPPRHIPNSAGTGRRIPTADDNKRPSRREGADKLVGTPISNFAKRVPRPSETDSELGPGKESLVLRRPNIDSLLSASVHEVDQASLKACFLSPVALYHARAERAVGDLECRR